MAKYKVVVPFDSGLNEVLNGVRYDYKQRRVVNWVKSANDKACIEAIRWCPDLKNVLITPPIIIHYHIFAKDKRRDRMNIGSAIDKSFEDGLQKAGKLKNDGWNEVYGATYDFDLDNKNPRVEIVIEEVTEESRNYFGKDEE